MRLDCLFYTSPATLPAFLATDAARVLLGATLVELAPRPTLAFALNQETPAHYPGLAGLLGGLPLADLALAHARLPAPLVPAPGAPVALATLRAALCVLREKAAAADHLTLLVHVDDAPALGACLHLADRFGIAWDALAHPETGLLDFARWLRDEALLTAANFSGLMPYSATPLDASAARHANRLSRLFAESAPGATQAHPDIILPGA